MLDAGSLVSGLRCLQLPEQSADDFAYGHFRSVGHQEARVGDDWSQGTADIARRPRTVTRSPKRQFDNNLVPAGVKGRTG